MTALNDFVNLVIHDHEYDKYHRIGRQYYILANHTKISDLSYLLEGTYGPT